jgi:hypothetical protein
MERVRNGEPQAAPAQRAVRGADSPTTPAMLRRIASAAGNRSTGRLARARMLAREDKADAKAAPKPVDYVFIMGKNLDGSKRADAFYGAARKHFVDMNAVPGATVVEAASLEEIVETVEKGQGVARNLYIVVHATPIGVEFALKKGDTGPYAVRIWYDKLVPESAALGARLAGKVDAGTTIRIRGCNVGRNQKFVAELHKALGGKGTLEAPMHRTSYDWEMTGDKVTSTREYATEFALIFPDKPEHRGYKPVDLAKGFAAKYPDSGLSEADWLKVLTQVKPQAVAKSYTWDVDTDPKTSYTDDEIADVMRGNINEPSEFFYTVGRPSKAKATVVAKQVRYEVPTKVVEKTFGKRRDLARPGDKDYGTFMATDVTPAPLTVP